MRSAAATWAAVEASRAGSPRCVERVEDAGRVAGPVVDDVDHAAAEGSEPLRDDSLNRSTGSSDDLVMRPRRPRARLALVIAPLLALLLALAGCLPPPPATPSAVGRFARIGRRPCDGPVAPHRRAARRLLPALRPRHAAVPRRPVRRLQQLAQMYVTEGNRYNVRGDIAFAQSIVETAWFYYPDYGQVRPTDNNFAGIGACDSCGTGFGFASALNGVRGAVATAPQLRRHQLARHHHPGSAGARSSGAARRRPPTTTSTTTSPRATRRCGTTWATATGRPRRTTPPSS